MTNSARWATSPTVPPWLLQRAASADGGLDALALLRRACHPAVVNHSIRVLRYGLYFTEREGIELDDAMLLHSCLMHDLGASGLAQGPERFEVQGADLAVQLLAAHGWTSEACQPIWTAIALHTTPHVAERISPLARVVRLSVMADFGADLLDSDIREMVEAELPRLDIERVLSGVVVEQALRDERRAPEASWPAALLAAHRSAPDPDARLAAF
ncbi:HD domain-containing protein [Micromonospora sp. NPDC051141]|uniref:HD domain-containing protein n=1 Tax=Micromonospora sp. NPDC051141 TaxID=3364284 RepID=UPI0037BD7565